MTAAAAPAVTTADFFCPNDYLRPMVNIDAGFIPKSRPLTVPAQSCIRLLAALYGMDSVTLYQTGPKRWDDSGSVMLRTPGGLWWTVRPDGNASKS